VKTKLGQPVLDLKALGEDGVIAGYGAVFGNRDSYGDVIQPGAFKRSLADHRRNKSRPKMFWQHDPSQPIGSWTEITEDDKGLLVTGQLNMDVQRGREAFALLKAGDIDGLSIGYRVVKASEDETQGVMLLKELTLVEVSVVSQPANPLALVSAVKAAELEDLRARLAAGDRLQQREMEELMKEFFGFSNSEAERAAGACLAGEQGVPAGSGLDDFWAAMCDADIVDLTGEPD
jgi:uncharacterized protein